MSARQQAEENLVLRILRERDAGVQSDQPNDRPLTPRMEARRIIDELDSHRRARRTVARSTLVLAEVVADRFLDEGDSTGAAEGTPQWVARVCGALGRGDFAVAVAYLEASRDVRDLVLLDALQDELS